MLVDKNHGRLSRDSRHLPEEKKTGEKSEGKDVRWEERREEKRGRNREEKARKRGWRGERARPPGTKISERPPRKAIRIWTVLMIAMGINRNQEWPAQNINRSCHRPGH